MKRILTLALGFVMILSSVAAMAAEVQIKGEMKQNFMFSRGADFYENGWDNQSEDNFSAWSRVRLQLDIIASENLKGVLQFEIGASQWGRPTGGFGFDGDGVNVETKHAYIAFNVPNTDLVFQVGLQNVALPAAAFGNPILANDAAAVVASYAINDMVSVVGVWARLLDIDPNNTLINNSSGSDEFDAWALVVPVKIGKFSVTPWAALARVGKDAIVSAYSSNNMPTNPVSNLLSPVAATALRGHPTTYDQLPAAALAPTLNGIQAGAYNPSTNPATNGQGGVLGATAPYAYNLVLRDQEALWAWWAGGAFQADFDPIKVMVDVMYGSVMGNNGISDRHGLYVGGAVDYKLSFMTVGVFGWYATGEDGDWRNGSEQMPMVDGKANSFKPTSFVFGGQAMNGVGEDNLLQDGPVGKWAIGLAAKDMSFIKDLSHTIRVMYARGTNDPASRRYTGLLEGIGMVAPGTANVVGLTRSGDPLTAPTPGVVGAANVHGTGALNNGAASSSTSSGTLFRAYGPGIQNIAMTSDDYMWEVNFDHKYQIYENLAATLEAGYAHLQYGGSDLFVHTDTVSAWKLCLGLTYKF